MKHYLKLTSIHGGQRYTTIYKFVDDGPLHKIKSYGKRDKERAFESIESAVKHWKIFANLEFNILTEREMFLELL